MPHADALQRACARVDLGGVDEVQLCPQNLGELDDATIEALQRIAPSSRFRLHANVRLPGLGLQMVDASSPRSQALTRSYFDALKVAHCALGATVYSLHAGRRAQASFEQMAANVQALEQDLGTPVAVEGLYPDSATDWLISSWAEYARLLESPISFALDLSHVHILAHQSGRIELSLVRELLSSPRCLEVHLSANDGCRDVHLRLSDCPTFWWQSCLGSIRGDSAVFYEGNEVRTQEHHLRLAAGAHRNQKRALALHAGLD